MERPYVVSELGVNHGGDIATALDMIEMSKDAGCDAVKLQMYDVANCTDKVDDEQKTMLEQCQFTDDEWRRISECAAAWQIDWFASAFCKSDLKRLEQFNPCRYKTAAPDFVSGGYWSSDLPRWASYEPRFEGLVPGYAPYWCYMSGAEVVFYCVSDYPASSMSYPSGIDRSIFQGISDHIKDAQPPLYGFMYYEKHFTLDRTMDGPDHSFALEPSMMKEYVDRIQTAFDASDDKRLLSYVGRFE